MRKLCAIFVGQIDILRAVGNLAVNGRTLFAPTKIYIIIVFYQYIYVGERRNFFVSGTAPSTSRHSRSFQSQTVLFIKRHKKKDDPKSSFFISIPLKGSFSLQCADSIRPCKHHHMPCSQASRKIAVLSFAPIS